MSGIFEWIIFIVLAGVAVVTAAGMLLTMSMYRAGLALMSSFVALAGLFILLDADLLAAIQVMMNVGGMLVMVLFMVMLMMDPGGEMMWDMKRQMHLPGPGAFSMHMPWGKPPPEEPAQGNQGQQDAAKADTATYTCPMHPDVRQPEPGKCPKCGMDLVPAESPAGTIREQSGEQEMMGMSPRQHYQMMVDMAMSTAQLPWAIGIGIVSAALLIVLVVQTPWPVTRAVPTQSAPAIVGELLLSRYMIGFEGAAFLIVAGIAGAVIFARREPGPAAPVHREEAPRQAGTYTCPMHPEVRQQDPGKCLKCGMDLVPAQEAQAAEDRSEQ
jgi:NADH:ubiquinone oxidoreductase subunit 6 (subunit J)